MKLNLKEIIKRFLPKSLIKKIKSVRLRKISRDTRQHFSEELSKLQTTYNSKRIILIGTAVSGNLGDQAISIAEINFLNENFPQHEIIEIQQTLYLYASEEVKPLITENDIILINGGGFLGTLWPIAENMARDIITSFPNNKIVIFPQTIYFENTKFGKEELSKSKAIFQKHKDLTLFVRDKQSLELAESFYKGGNFQEIYLVPDIVTSLKYDEPKAERNNIVFCLRKDKEQIDNSKQLSSIKKYVESFYPHYKTFVEDTVIDENLDMYTRKEAIELTMSKFRESKLIITDRLHGLILATISGTPCLALNNVSGKVKGAFEWVSFLPYVAFYDAEFEKHIDNLMNIDNTRYDVEELAKYHNQIKQSILRETNDKKS